MKKTLGSVRHLPRVEGAAKGPLSFQSAAVKARLGVTLAWGGRITAAACSVCRCWHAEARGRGARVWRSAQSSIGTLVACLCLGSVLWPSSTCLCSSGPLTRGARSAGLGGVTVVGGGRSPFVLASSRVRGLVIEAAWANPYGISQLDVGSIGVRYGWGKGSLATSAQILQTPTPFRELHVEARMSLEAAGGVLLNGGAALASLRDDRGAFGGESSVQLGAAVAVSRGLDLACAVETPIGGDEDASALGAGAGSATYLWGLGVRVDEGLVFVLEEERGGGWTSRKLGGEIGWPGVLAIRAGVSDSPFTVSIGVGVVRGPTALDMAVVQHETLGTTPHVSVSYCTSQAVTCSKAGAR
jgi:hypothetical protein